MGMYDCKFLFYFQFFSLFFLLTLFPWSVDIMKYEALTFFEEYLTVWTEKKKKICTFNLFPLSGLHYIQCVFKGWCILSTVQEKLQSVAIQLVKSTVLSSFSPHKTENCSWQKPVRNLQRKTDDFSPNLLHFTRQKSHLTSNGKMDCFVFLGLPRVAAFFFDKLYHEWTAELNSSSL